MEVIRQTQHRMEERRVHILHSALECFCRTSIEETTIVEIAKAAQVGEATIYRYFSNKAELVLQTGQYLWQSASQIFTDSFDSESHREKSGIAQIQALVQMFITVYDEHGKFYKFISDYDQFLLGQHLVEQEERQYRKSVYLLEQFFNQAVEKGMRDGSIRIRENWEEVYWMVSNILTAFSEKLLHGRQYPFESTVAPRRQMELACEVIINGISAMPNVNVQSK